MDWDESFAGMESEIEGLTGITAVTVTGLVGVFYIIEFDDPAKTDMLMLVVDDDSITPAAATLSVVELVEGKSDSGVTSSTHTINFIDPNDHPRFLYLNSNCGIGFGSDADGPLGDGEPEEFPRVLYLNSNVGFGFGRDEDGPFADGDPDDFPRFLYLNANATSDQPCPYISSVAPTLQTQGSAISVFGDSFGATQGTYSTEVRLYEDQDLSGSYVVMSATSWSDTELSVTIPAAATTGWVAVVHTNAEATCTGSNAKLLQVEQVPADFEAGWWLRTASKENVHTEDHTVLPGNNVTTSFRKIMNAIGAGRMELPLGDPIIDTVIDPVTRQGTLVQTYIDDRMRYGWFAEDLSHDYNEEGDAIAVISGRGMEVIALWAKIKPHDYPASPTLNPVWVYGSNDNFILNPGFDDDLDALLSNPGGEEGNDDDGNLIGWNERGDDVDSLVAIKDSFEARSGDWRMQLEVSDKHSGMEQSITVTPNKVYHVQCRIRDPLGSGMRITLALGGATDIVASTTYPNNFEFNDEILGELDNTTEGDGVTDGGWQVIDVEVHTGNEQTSLTVAIQNDEHATSIFNPFNIDDVTIEGFGLGLAPWEAFEASNAASSSFRINTTRTFDASAASCYLNGLTKFAGIQQFVTVNQLTKYTASIWLYTDAPAVDDTWKLVCRDKDDTAFLGAFEVVPNDGAWTNYKFSFTTPADLDDLIFRFAYTGPNNPLPVYIDSAALVPGEDASTAGKILNEVLDKMGVAGKLLYLNRTFTDDLDSKGQPWPSELSLDIEPTESLYGLLSRLVALGHEWEIVPAGYPEGNTGFELNVYTARSFNPETGIGQNLSKDPEGPVIMPGDATIGGRILKSVFGINTVMAIGDDGVWSEIQQHPWLDADQQPGDPAPHGYDDSFGPIEDVITVSATDATTVAQFAEARLADVKERESVQQIFMQRSAILRPFLDVNVGDSVYVDMPPYNPNPPVDDGAGGYTRLNPQRIRSIQASLDGEGSNMDFQVDVNRVVYEDQLAWNAMIAQLNERAPAENTGQGTGSVSGSGGVVSIIGGSTGGASVPHTHSLKSAEIKDKAASGDVSGTLPGTLTVQALKGVPVDMTIPAESIGDVTAFVYDYDSKVWEPTIITLAGAGNPYAAKMSKSSDQAISSNTQTELEWQVSDFDLGSVVSLSDNAFVAPIDGVYEVSVHVPWEAEDPENVRVEVQIDDAAADRGRLTRTSGYNGGADAYYTSADGNGMFEMLTGEKLTVDIYSTNVALTIRGDAGQEAWITFKLVAS
jgi:hypothetical protein